MTYSHKRISLKDIATKAGVSTSLVSFVLNGKQKQHRINEAVAERIQKIAKEMNYKPNAAAKSLRDGRSRTIGVVVSDISNPFFAHIARHIETTAEKYGYTVQFSSSDENAQRTAVLVDNMLNRGVDCIILVPCEGSEQTVRELLDKKTPLVLLDRYFPGISTNCVCLNNRQAAYDATSHLFEEGFRNIGMIGYDFRLQHMLDRFEGYRAAMTDHGLQQNISVEYADHTDMQASCEAAVRNMLDRNVDALIFATNAIAVDCLYAIRRRGIIIPDQLGIIGFDGGYAFEFFYSPLSYIQQPLEFMAQKAVEILLEQLNSASGILQHVQAEGALVKRASSMQNGRK